MYQPSEEILKKYADVLIWFALNNEQGMSRGDVVMINIPECAKPMLLPLQEAVLKRWGHPLVRYFPDGTTRPFYEMASDEQISYKPKEYMLARVKDVDHTVSIIAESDKHELEGIDPSKIMLSSKAVKFYRDALNAKENKWDLTRTLGLYGTQAMADEVDLSLEEYREQIIEACYLDDPDPVQKWEELSKKINFAKEHLNSLPIERVHVVWEDVDLKVQLGPDRQWMWWTWRNIPSFELFISPDWRGTSWWIKFNQPLYRYGNLIKDIELKFEDGLVVESKASQNEAVLQEMIATKNADKIGEFSLTDNRFSRITKFMWETLYDENVWWPFGNTHVALGMAYKDSLPTDPSKLSEKEREDLGYNDSVIHTDIVSTTDRTVTATMTDGSQQVIYENGRFTFLQDE